MSHKDLLAFLKGVDENETLKKELAAAVREASSTASIVAFARKRGFDFTEGELQQEARSHAATTGRELSDQDLDSVVGGLGGTVAPYPTASQLLLNVYTLNRVSQKVLE